jgi:hydroxyacylglutathione hydrolase
MLEYLQMLSIVTLPVGQMQTNCYLVADEELPDCLVIDPGDDAEYIKQEISRRKLIPKLIIATHGHFDHIMAVTELQLIFRIPFFVHSDDEFLVCSMRKSARYFLGIDCGPEPKVNGYLKDSQKLVLGKETFTVISTPGHTPGSVCIYSKANNTLFTGDLIFAGGGIGRTDFSYSSSQKLQISLKKIFNISSSTVIYPGHGDDSTLSDEQGLK